MAAIKTTAPALGQHFTGVRLLALTPVEMKAALIAFVLAIVARFPALLPGYSIDDYQFVSISLPTWFDPLAAMNGRALGYAVYAGLARLGAAPPRAGVLYILLLTAALVAIGIVACRLWRVSERLVPATLVVSIIVLHPYQAEMFTFRTATMVAAIPMMLTAAAILLCLPRSWKHWFTSVLLLTFAVCIYQVVLSYLALLIVFTVAFRITESEEALRESLPALGRLIGAIAVSVGLYMASAIFVSRVSGIPLGSRTSPIGIAGLGKRAMDLAAGIRWLLVGNEPVLPLTVKLLLIGIFAAGLAACIVQTRRQGSKRRLTGIVLAAAVGAPLCLGIGLLLRDFPVAPRVISQTAVYVAGLMVMVYSFAGARMRRVLVAGVGVVLFSFIGLNEQILTDQIRVNRRDMAEANRILMRMEMLPDFNRFTNVVVSGGSRLYPGRISTVQNDINVSALYRDWSKVALINEATGYSFGDPSAADKVRADSLCKERPKWPAPESVTSIGTTAVVCLPKP